MAGGVDDSPRRRAGDIARGRCDSAGEFGTVCFDPAVENGDDDTVAGRASVISGDRIHRDRTGRTLIFGGVVFDDGRGGRGNACSGATINACQWRGRRTDATATAAAARTAQRTDARRAGKEGVRKSRSRWSAYQ